MPRLDNLPALEVIRGLKGVLDFYYWRGIPCVRKWPHKPNSHRTQAEIASAALFGAVIQGYSLLGAALKLLFEEDAADQPRTARDIYVSAVLGHLHEINMDEVIALLEQNNAYLLALQNLLNTLNSIGTDLLLVRGMDQLFSFKDSLHDITTDTISGAGGYLDSHTPAAGHAWRITSIGAVDITSATTPHAYRLFHAPTSYAIVDLTAAFGANVRSYHQCDLWLRNGEYIRIYFTGGLLADTCRIDLLGYIMTLET